MVPLLAVEHHQPRPIRIEALDALLDEGERAAVGAVARLAIVGRDSRPSRSSRGLQPQAGRVMTS